MGTHVETKVMHVALHCSSVASPARSIMMAAHCMDNELRWEHLDSILRGTSTLFITCILQHVKELICNCM